MSDHFLREKSGDTLITVWWEGWGVYTEPLTNLSQKSLRQHAQKFSLPQLSIHTYVSCKTQELSVKSNVFFQRNILEVHVLISTQGQSGRLPFGSIYSPLLYTQWYMLRLRLTPMYTWIMTSFLVLWCRTIFIIFGFSIS